MLAVIVATDMAVSYRKDVEMGWKGRGIFTVHGSELDHSDATDGEHAPDGDGIVQQERDDQRRGVLHQGLGLALPCRLDDLGSNSRFPAVVFLIRVRSRWADFVDLL